MENDTNKITMEQLIQRMEERKRKMMEKREERDLIKKNNSAENENVEYIFQSFVQMKDELNDKIEMSNKVNSSALKDHLDSLVDDVLQMQTALNEASMVLPPFLVKKTQEMVYELNEQVQSSIKELQPKKKFGFRASKEKSTKTVKQMKDKECVDDIDSSSVIDSFLEKSLFGFKDLVNETLVKTDQELKDRQLNLQNLTHCKVTALGNPSTLQASNLKNCTIILGPLSRSAFISNCTNCTFVMACQQLRIHDTYDCYFYIHVTGAAIIENCQKVNFAPYNLEYDSLESHYTQSNLDKSINNWDKIDDFKWLNENEESPNFSLLPEAERNNKWL